MTWFAFAGLNSGKAVDLAGAQEKIAVTWGFHGYAAESQAEAQPNSVNVLTKVEASALVADYRAAVAQQSQPGGKNANILNPATAANAVATQATGTLTDFLSRLSRGSTWIRVAEVALGLVLIAVGVAKMTSAVPAATKLAKAVA
jgi:hypothetical protein